MPDVMTLVRHCASKDYRAGEPLGDPRQPVGKLELLSPHILEPSSRKCIIIYTKILVPRVQLCAADMLSGMPPSASDLSLIDMLIHFSKRCRSSPSRAGECRRTRGRCRRRWGSRLPFTDGTIRHPPKSSPSTRIAICTSNVQRIRNQRRWTARWK